MARVYVSVGSNIERERNVRAAVAMLGAQYGPLVLSSVYESDPVGFAGGRFYNLVVGFDSPETPESIVQTLRSIEDRCGRARDGARFSSRTLDLDLLLYDDLVLRENGLTVPREEILSEAFVLGPLAEIAGGRRHPVERRTLASLWSEFPGAENNIWPVPFDPQAGGRHP